MKNFLDFLTISLLTMIILLIAQIRMDLQLHLKTLNTLTETALIHGKAIEVLIDIKK